MRNKKIILFRFYSEYETCLERIKIWKYLNPEIPIYALFGGEKSQWKYVKSIFSSSPIENIYIIDSDDKYWKWLHADQTLLEWYVLHGNKVKFDYLFDVEWDLLPIASINKIYKSLPSDKEISLTGLQDFGKVKSGWKWVTGQKYKDNYLDFEKYIKDEFNIKKLLFASLGSGHIFTPNFIEEFSQLYLNPKIINPIISELIYPLATQILKYNILDTGLHPGWFKKQASVKYFNCWSIPIKKNIILDERSKINGRKIFHPVKYQFFLNEILLD